MTNKHLLAWAFLDFDSLISVCILKITSSVGVPWTDKWVHQLTKMGLFILRVWKGAFNNYRFIPVLVGTWCLEAENFYVLENLQY